MALSHEKLCEHRIRKNKQIKSTANDGKIMLEINKLCVNKPRQSMKQIAFARSIGKESII